MEGIARTDDACALRFDIAQWCVFLLLKQDDACVHRYNTRTRHATAAERVLRLSLRACLGHPARVAHVLRSRASPTAITVLIGRCTVLDD